MATSVFTRDQTDLQVSVSKCMASRICPEKHQKNEAEIVVKVTL